MTRKILALTAIAVGCILIITSALFAQPSNGVQELYTPPATGIAYELTPSVAFSGSSFNYAYGLHSMPTSQQKIWWVNIAPIAPTVAVSIAAPTGWRGSQHGNLHLVGLPDAVGFISLAAETDMNPGTTLTGFQFTSPGPPGIATAYCRGHVDPPTLDDTRPYRLHSSPPWTIDSVRVFTLAPTPPPAGPFDPAGQIDRLAGLIQQAVSIGWIRDHELVNQLALRLAQAKVQIQAGHTREAGEILTDLRDHLRAGEHEDRGDDDREQPAITQTAVTLVRANLDPIISALSPRDGDENGDSGRHGDNGSGHQNQDLQGATMSKIAGFWRDKGSFFLAGLGMLAFCIV